MKYLLDTNICVYFLTDKFGIKEKLENIGRKNCAVSEITIAELKYGIEKSDKQKKEENRNIIETLIESLNVIPIITCFDLYAKEKFRLQKEGKIIDEFDLFIGCTAIVNEMILVTNNKRHFERLQNIKIENWVEKKIP